MSKSINTLKWVAVALALGAFGPGRVTQAQGQGDRPQPASTAATQPAPKPPAAMFARAPLSFEKNMGQTDPTVEFLSRGPGYALFLTRGGDTVVRLSEPNGTARVLRTTLIGARKNARAKGRHPAPGVVNYLRGRNGRSQTGVGTFERVSFTEVYAGIDVVYYGNQRQLEYDFVVGPGADPSAISMRVDGADSLTVNEAGELVIEAGAVPVRHGKPVAYQTLNGVRHDVAASYKLSGSTISFTVGDYDREVALVIDPIVIYWTLLDGNFGDIAQGVAVDAFGNAYLGGATSSSDFPTLNAFDSTPNANGDVFVTKLDPGGSIVYSTYLGGGGTDDFGGIAVDASGSVVVVGGTGFGFPVTTGAYDPGFNLYQDGFVTKLAPSGSSLVFSTYLGGSYLDTATGVGLDASGDIYVTGWTDSTNFPTTPGTFSRTPHGNREGFVAKLNAAGSTLVFSTLLGGSNWDEPTGIAVDSVGSAYVTGYTMSNDYPVTGGVYDPTFNGSKDSFVTKVDPAGTSLVYSTYLNPSAWNVAVAIAVDSAGQAHVASYEEGVPAVGGLLRKFDAAGSSLVYSRSFMKASSSTSGINDVAVDADGSAYITGVTSDPAFPATADAWDPSFNGRYAAFATRLDPAGVITYSTFIGGNPVENSGYGIDVDPLGRIYVVGQQRLCCRVNAAYAVRIDPAGLRPTHVVVTPATASLVWGQQHCATATVTNESDAPEPGVLVHFSWVASTGASGDRTTDAAGVATFCFPADAVGYSTINAWADTNGDNYRDVREPAGSASLLVYFRFQVDATVATYGMPTTFVARLTSVGYDVAGKTVAFTFMGQPMGSAQTDSEGVARLPFETTGIDSGEYVGVIGASFAGDGPLPASSGTNNLVVLKATPQITWTPAVMVAGTAVGPAQLNATASAPGTLSYSIEAGTVLGFGRHPVLVEFTPAAPQNFNAVGLWQTIMAAETAPTSAGTDVAPVTVVMTALTMTFGDVTASGATTVTPIDPAAENLLLPGQFSVQGMPGYEVDTTAAYTSPITLCFTVAEDDPDAFASLQILHGMNGAWVPESTTHDFENRLLCAAVSSLSPFAIGRLSASYQVQPLFDTTKPLKGGSTAPIKIRLLSSSGANVSSPYIDARATQLQWFPSGATMAPQDSGRANEVGYFRYDASIGGYIYNLSTKSLAGGTYELSIRISGDPTARTVQFLVR